MTNYTTNVLTVAQSKAYRFPKHRKFFVYSHFSTNVLFTSSFNTMPETQLFDPGN